MGVRLPLPVEYLPARCGASIKARAHDFHQARGERRAEFRAPLRLICECVADA
jgi:hypothetical protein